MTAPADRELLHRWLVAQIRKLLTEARKRHPGVLADDDTDLLTQVIGHERLYCGVSGGLSEAELDRLWGRQKQEEREDAA
jgi:hypothetical protein